jgi:Sulfotransferase family
VTSARVPDFFVIGAPKAGTTALHAALAQHPGLFLSTVKEPKFFLCDDRPPQTKGGPGDAHSAQEWVWQRDRYEALFADARVGVPRGESTPFYLADVAAQHRIRRANPEARLIAVLRDPVDRAHSNWTHLWSDGLEPLPEFMAAMAAEDDRVRDGWAPFWHYRRLGLYGAQLDHLYSLFPREQVLLLRYRDLVEDPVGSLERVTGFLGVDHHPAVDARPENVKPFVTPGSRTRTLANAVRAGATVGAYLPPGVWRTASRPLLRLLQAGGGNRPRLAVGHRRVLVELFADDIRLLERVTGESYEDWLGDEGPGEFSTHRTSAG